METLFLPLFPISAASPELIMGFYTFIYQSYKVDSLCADPMNWFEGVKKTGAWLSNYRKSTGFNTENKGVRDIITAALLPLTFDNLLTDFY